MDFQEVVNKRKMVRSFKPDPIPDKVMKSLLDNMMKSPSAGFSQGAEFMVLSTDDARKSFFQQWGTKEERMNYSTSWPNLENAPLIILVLTAEKRYRERYGKEDKHGLSDDVIPWWFVDAGMATMLGLLTAVDQGLIATFTGIQSQEYIREIFMTPIHMTCVGAMLLGYQKGEYRPSKSVKLGRRPKDEVIHYNHW